MNRGENEEKLIEEFLCFSVKLVRIMVAFGMEHVEREKMMEVSPVFIPDNLRYLVANSCAKYACRPCCEIAPFCVKVLFGDKITF